MGSLSEHKIKIRSGEGELTICTMGEFLEMARHLDILNNTRNDQLYVMCALNLLKCQK